MGLKSYEYEVRIKVTVETRDADPPATSDVGRHVFDLASGKVEPHADHLILTARDHDCVRVRVEDVSRAVKDVGIAHCIVQCADERSTRLAEGEKRTDADRFAWLAEDDSGSRLEEVWRSFMRGGEPLAQVIDDLSAESNGTVTSKETNG